MSTYQTIGEGDILLLPDNAKFVLACCDCGLAHEVTAIRRKDKKTELKWFPNGRRTYMLRHWMKKKKEGIFKDG